MSDEKPKLPSPYLDSLFKPDFRLNVEVSQEDINTIRSVCPVKGAIQFLIADYVKSLADELRARKLSYSPSTLDTFVQLVQRRNKWELFGPENKVQRSHHFAALGPANGPNEQPAAGRVCKGNPHTPSKRAGTKSKAHKGSTEESQGGKSQ